MLAARGALAPRAHEQLALLVLLTADADPSIRLTANQTLDRIPPRVLSAFLARSDVDPGIKEFFEKRGVAPSEIPAPDIEAPLVEEEVEPGAQVAEAPSDQDALDEPEPSPPVTPDDTSAESAADQHEAAIIAAARARIPTVQRLSLMSITDRIKVAMRGNREERMVLIRDPNKLVALAVLSSPKITEQEVESFCRMGSISEDVLRVIGTGRSWIKNYGVISGLTFNPKTPIGISMGFVNRLIERDIRMLSTDRNVPEPLRVLARKMMQASQSRKR